MGDRTFRRSLLKLQPLVNKGDPWAAFVKPSYSECSGHFAPSESAHEDAQHKQGGQDHEKDLFDTRPSAGDAAKTQVRPRRLKAKGRIAVLGPEANLISHERSQANLFRR